MRPFFGREEAGTFYRFLAAPLLCFDIRFTVFSPQLSSVLMFGCSLFVRFPVAFLVCTHRNTSCTQVTLVGKGVCFDTGGLDIKPAAGMLTMKKDMGGGAQV